MGNFLFELRKMVGLTCKAVLGGPEAFVTYRPVPPLNGQRMGYQRNHVKTQLVVDDNNAQSAGP